MADETSESSDGSSSESSTQSSSGEEALSRTVDNSRSIEKSGTNDGDGPEREGNPGFIPHDMRPQSDGEEEDEMDSSGEGSSDE